MSEAYSKLKNLCYVIQYKKCRGFNIQSVLERYLEGLSFDFI